MIFVSPILLNQIASVVGSTRNSKNIKDLSISDIFESNMFESLNKSSKDLIQFLNKK